MAKQHLVTSSLVPHSPRHKAYGNLTGNFPFKLSRGNCYIYILYDHDLNAILVEPVQNCQAHTLANAWEVLTNRLWQSEHTHAHFVLDNELSNDLAQAFKKYNIKHKCVPPNLHSRNLAERAIQTFKHHFLSGLSICHSQYPIQEWDHHLPQAKMTLNRLRISWNNPHLLAYF